MKLGMYENYQNSGGVYFFCQTSVALLDCRLYSKMFPSSDHTPIRYEAPEYSSGPCCASCTSET